MMMRLSWPIWAFFCISQAVAESPPPEVDSADLAVYLSRPDIRAPKMTVTTYDLAENLSSGYIFVAPYTRQVPYEASRGLVPTQSGPHIYDNYGELVWSGGEFTKDAVAGDFRPILVNGTHHLSFLQREDDRTRGLERRTGYVLNSHYDQVRRVDITQDYDIHEFWPLNDATSFLRILSRPGLTDKLIQGETIYARDNCAAELDFNGTELFRFCALDKIDPEETNFKKPSDDELKGAFPWNLYHMNSIDKFANGDYLLSLRYTCAIYRVSHVTGEVVWRLGGKSSDFSQDFHFSGQHDARIVSENDTVLILSLLDNAAAYEEHYMQTANVSSFKVVALYQHQDEKHAQLLKSLDRPDGELSRLRGSGHVLPSGGAFVCWSVQGYLTEFAEDGHIVQEVRFNSEGLHTYRAYKSDFVGKPSKPPTLVTFVSLDDRDRVQVSFHVSWNGATEIATWDFLDSREETGTYRLLGKVSKATFETSFVARTSRRYFKAVARDLHSVVIGESGVVERGDFPPGVLPQSTTLDDMLWRTRQHWDRVSRSWEILLLSSFSAVVIGFLLRQSFGRVGRLR